MKTIKFRENPSPEELLKQLLGDGWRWLQDGWQDGVPPGSGN